MCQSCPSMDLRWLDRDFSWVLFSTIASLPGFQLVSCFLPSFLLHVEQLLAMSPPFGGGLIGTCMFQNHTLQCQCACLQQMCF